MSVKKCLLSPYRFRRFLTIPMLVLVSTTLHADDSSEGNAANMQYSTNGDAANCCVIPSLSAIHVKQHEPSSQEIMRARIELSPVGLRVLELGSDATFIMLQNFLTEQGWLIDRKRRIYHELPLTSDPMGPMPNPVSDSSFLGHKPCVNLTSSNAEQGVWRGRKVDAVRCFDGAGQEQAAELLDHVYRIVVYRRDRQGYIDELQDVQSRKFEQGFFLPPDDFREVEKREFFHGAPALRAYSPGQ